MVSRPDDSATHPNKLAEIEKDALILALGAQVQTLTARVAELEAQVAKLTEAVQALRELLGRNSGNSNLPPSSDPPGNKGAGGSKKRKKGKGRRRGGQPGHRGSHRMLLPAEQMDELVANYRIGAR